MTRAFTDLTETRPDNHRLLIHRNRTTGERVHYHCYSPAPVPLATLVHVAGSRRRVEETFQAGKGLTGLDEHQLRRFTSCGPTGSPRPCSPTHSSPQSAPTNTPIILRTV